jgi:hypothetical protein
MVNGYILDTEVNRRVMSLQSRRETFTGMGEDDDDRVHSGGLPTTTVLRTVLTATVEWSRSRKYKVHG